jgi:GT2 family glycosyltransferase
MDKDRQISELRKKLERRARDVERLSRWNRQLENGLSTLLNSRPWKIGRALGELQRRVLLRPSAPPLPESVERARERSRAWHASSEQAGREPAETRIAPLTRRPPMEVGRAASERWRLAAAEYILDSLRTLLPVTIIIPIHDACKNLERCLESVVENTSASAKLLLVDGANADPDISSLLEEYEALENVRVLRNEAHPGLARAVDRGLSESEGDVVLLGPDTEVTPRWLENLTLAAHTNPRTATVTPLSNGAAAFSVPEPDRENPTPDGLTRDGTGRLITQQSRRLYPQTPVGNRFCIYIKRATLNEVGSFDGKNFPRSYGGEEDFCLRSLKRGWNNVVDDATFVFHRRADSSGDKQREAAAPGTCEARASVRGLR